MDAVEAILTRRSVRQFTEQSVPEQLTEELLACAMSAPSAGNEQPWEFIVLKDQTVFKRIQAVHPFAQALDCASVSILVCGNLFREKYRGYWVQDCAAAVQNILVAAHARGLGAVWLGIHPVEERVAGLREIIGAPPQIVPFALIPLGFAAQQPMPADRYDAQRIHYDRW